MRAVIARLRADEQGFTMIVAVMVLLVVMLFSAAAYTAANGDLRQGAHSRDSKRAYAAAEAGLQWYQSQLAADPTYWTKCDNVPVPLGSTVAPVNQMWNGSGSDPRQWRQIDGTNQWYTIELLPANGSASCLQGNTATFVDDASRTFRLRVTGSAGDPRNCVAPCPPRRSIIGTFRRSSFLDFLYFTDYETYAPALQLQAAGYPRGTTNPSGYLAWAQTNCAKHWWQGRGDAGNVFDDGTVTVTQNSNNYYNVALGCSELAFGNDTVAGPLHTNDSIMICGNPGTTFGRSAGDQIEIANGDTANYASVRICPNPPPGQPATANGPGTHNPQAEFMAMPTTTGPLAAAAGAAGTTYHPVGRTTIQLLGATNQVRINGVTHAWPPNGVIHVSNNGSCAGYDPADPDNSSTACGDAFVYGTYNKGLTIAAQNDIVVRDDIINNGGGSASDSMLGLIATNFVRVWHPVDDEPTRYRDAGSPYWGKCRSNELTGGGSPPTGGLGNVRIDAAILALTGSFMVDAYDCGSSFQGTLTVNGAIVQKYRGPVAYRGGSPVVDSGYIKNYTYDDRFRLRNPPQFLPPESAVFKVVRVNQQQPAT
jgi:Tfp pilus assembly protein PilX